MFSFHRLEDPDSPETISCIQTNSAKYLLYTTGSLLYLAFGTLVNSEMHSADNNPRMSAHVLPCLVVFHALVALSRVLRSRPLLISF